MTSAFVVILGPHAATAFVKKVHGTSAEKLKRMYGMPSLGMFTKPRSILNNSMSIKGCKKAHHIPSEDRLYLLVISRTTRAQRREKNLAVA
jgi:hypothetical protein